MSTVQISLTLKVIWHFLHGGYNATPFFWNTAEWDIGIQELVKFRKPSLCSHVATKHPPLYSTKTDFLKTHSCVYFIFETPNFHFSHTIYLCLTSHNCGHSCFPCTAKDQPSLRASSHLCCIFSSLCLISSYPNNSFMVCSMDNKPAHPMLSFPFSLMSLQSLL